MRLSHACVVVGVSGFVALSFEILWARVGAVGSADSPAMFGLLLGWYLLGLGVGAALSRRACREGRAHVATIACLLAGACTVALGVAPAMAWGAAHRSWALALPVVALAAGGLGAVFPLVAQASVPGDERAGQGLSWLLSSNILGSALGSWLTGLYWLNTHGVAEIGAWLTVLGFSVSAALLLPVFGAARVVPIGLVAVVLVGSQGPRLGEGLWEQLAFRLDYQGESFARIQESRSGVVMITEAGMVLGGGIYDGYVDTDLVDDRNMIVRAYGMAALHAAPREVLVIGLSMGAWTQVLVNMPGVERVTVVEINEGYLSLIGDTPLTADLLTDPRVEIHVDDGRRWLQAHPDRHFDLVVANMSYHWRSGASVVLSREYMHLVQSRLAPGGIFHFNTTWSGDVLATAFETFAHGFRFVNFATVSDSPMVYNKERLSSALAAWRIDGKPVYDPEDPVHVVRIEAVLAMADDLFSEEEMVLESRESVLARLVNPRIVTDDNMACEWPR